MVQPAIHPSVLSLYNDWRSVVCIHRKYDAKHFITGDGSSSSDAATTTTQKKKTT